MNESSTGKSSIGIEGNVAAALGYPIGLLALILLITEKENRFVRHHALQSLLWIALFLVVYFFLFIGSFIIGFILMFLGIVGSATSGSSAFAMFPLLSLLVIGVLFLTVILTVIGFVGGMIYSAVKAYRGETHLLPIVGKFAQKWA